MTKHACTWVCMHACTVVHVLCKMHLGLTKPTLLRGRPAGGLAGYQEPCEGIVSSPDGNFLQTFSSAASTHDAQSGSANPDRDNEPKLADVVSQITGKHGYARRAARVHACAQYRRGASL